MTSTRLTDGTVLYFPRIDASGTPVGLDAPALAAVIPLIREDELLLFTTRLISGARKRRFEPRWSEANRSRLVAAGMCIERALALPGLVTREVSTIGVNLASAEACE